MNMLTKKRWRRVIGEDGTPRVYDKKEGGAFCVASCNDENDALLISAAPDMYEALDDIVGWLEHNGVIKGFPYFIEMKARKAMDKAEGVLEWLKRQEGNQEKSLGSGGKDGRG